MTDIVIDAFNFTLIAASASVGASNGAKDNEELSSKILLNMLKKLKNTFYGSRFIAVWDEHGGTDFRKEIYPDYKANRTGTIVEFDAIGMAKPLFEFMGIRNVSFERTEGDDTIFVLCKALKEKGDEVIIVSRDKDMLQVVQKSYADRQYEPTRKIYLEVPSYDIVSYKAMVGDSSDNIMGVKGIGKVGALKVLSGEKELTESQLKEYNMYRSIIDAEMHPRFQENYIRAREFVRTL